jgi:hypothetical protein
LNQTSKNESEGAFEQYLEPQGLNWARIPTSDHKQPDYRIEHNGIVCVFEVKEFDDPDPKPSGGHSPCPPIREKIHAAAKQFRTYKDCCCALVLWNTNFYRTVLPQTVLSAAFGEYIRENRAPLGAEPSRYRFSGAAELRPDCNTRISAIVVLGPYRLNHLWLEVWRRLDAKRQRQEAVKTSDQFSLLHELSPDGTSNYSYDGTIRTIVLENPYARVPFPHDLFVGEFDQRWRMNKETGWFGLAFMGSELERLKGDGVPFIYL